jgi:hypothetical protein
MASENEFRIGLLANTKTHYPETEVITLSYDDFINLVVSIATEIIKYSKENLE